MIGCEHHTTLIQSEHSSNGNERVEVCVRCGEIFVRAAKDGVPFFTKFSLVNNHLLVAASQAYRLSNDRDAEDVAGKTVSKPLDFGHLRLYQVQLHWRMKDGKQGTEYFVVAADSPNQGYNSASTQIRKIYAESYDNNPEMSYWDVKGYALNVLQPLAWSVNGITLLETAFWECFVAGEYVCSKCGFRLSKRVLDASSGNVGIARDSEIPSCMNDGTTMEMVTWRQAAEDAGRIAQSYAERMVALENAWPEGFAMPAEGQPDTEGASHSVLPVNAATDDDPISACCAGNTGGARHVGCVYEGCCCE